jgi:hypothetical protein
VGRYLWIEGNDALTSLTGLENITTVSEHLFIGYNTSLTSLKALQNITSVGGSLGIGYNTSLTNLSGLENLTSVGEDLYIYSNDALTNLCALYNVNLAGIELEISNNTNLSMDTANALETLLRDHGFTGISDIYDNNGSGLVSCDIDEDGVFDDFDECEDTPVNEIVDSYGCSIEQLVPCDGDWKNHGKYVSALAKTANSFVYESLITEDEKDDLMEEKASSDCGK